MSATPAQIRAWSEEVARDPGTLAFLPLAEAYRQAGRRDAALRLCLRGLERNPTNVEAHYLLGLLYREGGEPVKAFDEWDMALSLDPEHAGARREIGLVCAERGEWGSALRHLERAAAANPTDDEVRDALARARSQSGTPAAPTPTAPVEAAPAAAAPPAPAPPTPAPAPPASPWDAAQAEFRALIAERGILGALLMDGQGFVVAGEMQAGGADRGPEVAAALHGASAEAERALRHLGLGTWRGMLVETPESTVRIAPAADDAMLAVAASREVPTGWTLRIAARASTVAARLLGTDDGGGKG